MEPTDKELDDIMSDENMIDDDDESCPICGCKEGRCEEVEDGCMSDDWEDCE